MSTKKTREAIAALRTVAGGSGIMRQLIADALAEVDAIERAAKVLADACPMRPSGCLAESWSEMVRTIDTISEDAP